MENIHICCPKCHWEPDGQPYWQCVCGTRWDTFSTGARCPGCGKVWEYTRCPELPGGCNEWSQHLAWYHGLDDMVMQMLDEVREQKQVKANK